MSEETAESRLKETFFVVEATSFEVHCLWQHHAEKSDNRIFPAVTWEQVNPGWVVTVGELDNRPVVLSLSWVRINDKLVMFWDQCSQVADSVMAEAWIDRHFTTKWDRSSRDSKTDANNFHHCIHAIREAA